MTDYTPPLFDHALDAGELDRNLLWKRQRAQRAAYRAQLTARLQGDPVRRLELTDAWQPWHDFVRDMTLPPLPPDPETVPVTNQNLNS